MKIIFKGLAIASLFSLLTASQAFAATTPALGATDGYAILSSTFTNTSPTTINGGVGFTTAPAVVPLGTHANYGSGSPYSQAGTDQGVLLNALNVQPCTFTFAPGAIDLSTDITHGPVGVYSPGVYCSIGAMNVSAALTLNGSGTYVFRPTGALTVTAGSAITLAGASACDVFWIPTQATTIGANVTFVGTVIDDAGITVGANTVWDGNALSFGGTVTTDTDTITSPICIVPVPVVVVDSGWGGIYSVPWVTPFIKVLKSATPRVLSTGPGAVVYTYTVTNIGDTAMNTITLTDNKCSQVIFVSGDTNNDSILDKTETWTYSCTSVLSETTTNIATATGHATVFTATDTASATVVVGTTTAPMVLGISTSTATTYPTLPNTGVAPQNGTVLLDTFILMMLSSILGLVYVSSRKKITL